MKKGLTIVVLAAIAAGAYYTIKLRLPAASSGSEQGRRTTAVIQQRSIDFFVNAAGEISPADQVSVRPEVNGRIAELAVDVGDKVRRGELLFALDDQELQIELESRDKDRERAQLELDQTARDYKRAQELFEGKLISLELYEQSKTTYDLGRNSLDRAQNAIDQVQDRLRKTRIGAPFDCTVLTRPVSIGQAVSGSGGVGGGTEVLTIANLNDLVINAHVNQADVSRLHVDQLVQVTVEAVPGLTINGRVERIAPQATIRNGIKGFAGRILLKDADPRVRPGMTANIRIPVASAESAVATPLVALFTELNPETQQQERFVFVKHGARYERRLVEIGVSDNFYVEVTRGLSPGETVALELPKDELARLHQPESSNRNGAGGGR